MEITLASGCSLQNCSYFSEAKIQERKEREEAELMLPYFHFSLFQVSFPLEGLLSALGNSAEKLSLSSFRLCPLLLDVSEVNTPSIFKVSLYCLFLSVDGHLCNLFF